MNTKYKKWTVYRHISPSNKVYIGITCNPVWHRWQNGKGYRGSPAFLAAIKKYGWDNIKHEIVAEGLSEADAKQMEKILISLYKSKKQSYNISDGGDGWAGAHPPMSEETKAKISAANKGKNTWSKGSKRGPYSKEHCIKISEGLKGLRKGISTGPRSEETKAKISSSRQGYKWICKPWEPPKQVAPFEYQAYIDNGWSHGKLIVINDNIYKWDKQSQSWQIYEPATENILLKKAT